ncbi:DUF6491 family protein [Thermomonas fusca]|jgi:hypothetical protein
MKAIIAAAIALGLTACATGRLSDTERLALYQQHAGAPVNQIRYLDPMGWDRIDDQHVVLQMRPNESWLLRLSGPCLQWTSGSPFIGLSSFSGMTLSRFDKVVAPGSSQLSCLIQEIRPVDVKALRAAEKSLREKPRTQASGM